LGKKSDGLSERDASTLAVDAVVELSLDLGIPQTLGAVGVTEEHIPAMALDAMKSGNVAINPRQTTVKDIQMLYKWAM
jgi:alcohol dehydrogenase